MNYRSAGVPLLLLLAVSAYAEVVQWTACNYEPNVPINCTVHEVRVNPCKEAAQNKPCRLKRGHDASISFDYTADFEGTALESRAYWATEVVDLPFLGMETNACTATECPVTPGKKQSYTVSLPISKKYPVRTYDVKWKLWNEQQQECCFKFQIKLHK
ncbi:MD-2-related lipid-recognition protein [Cephus cinctus]|uniref:MD-2-related lipid-recognition protein n=1 Tax=Cephus cinctus TaxID=211228 RepID=A0AAJ7BJ06_CEPCN|nr:MD-2-related lipid-recognition protein [Cephus cinctus]